MRKLLEVYKKCRFMDRLMNTSFFHEDKFMGLIERVRRVSTTTTAARVLDHKNRLFHETSPSTTSGIVTSPSLNHLKLQMPLPNTNAQKIKSKQYKIARHELSSGGGADDNITMDMHRRKHSTGGGDVYKQPIVVIDDEDDLNSPERLISSPPINETFGSTPNKLFGVVMTNIDKASKETDDISLLSIQSNQQKYNQNHQEGCLHNSTSKSISNNDSGNHSKTDWGEASCCSSSDITTDINSSSLIKPSDDHTSNSCCSIEMAGDDLSEFVCARLSALIKAQLVNALKEINNRFSCKASFSNDNLKLDDSSATSIVTAEATADDNTAAAIALHKDTADTCLLEADVAAAAAADDNTCRSEVILDTIDDNRCSQSTVLNSPTTSNIASVPSECFLILDSAPQTHTFQLTLFHPINAQQFYRAVQFDHRLLRTGLPPGVWVR